MPILAVEAQPVTAWKNGGGSTRSIAIHPPGAGLDDFLWRISVATVSTDGPFSTFPEIDRHLMLLDGDGMVLDSVDDTIRLTEVGQVGTFPGERPIIGRLLGGPTLDLNVMTRRGRVRGALTLATINEPFQLVDRLLVIDGDLRADGEALAPGDAVFAPAWIEGQGRIAYIHLVQA